jgi:hypothetical protein
VCDPNTPLILLYASPLERKQLRLQLTGRIYVLFSALAVLLIRRSLRFLAFWRRPLDEQIDFWPRGVKKLLGCNRCGVAAKIQFRLLPSVESELFATFSTRSTKLLI